MGLFHLFKLFLRYCYEPEDSNQDLFTHNYIPKPNNFSDLSEYFVRKVRGQILTSHCCCRLRSFPQSLVNAISRIRFENGKTPSVVRQFLIDQLRYNDNTANPVSHIFVILHTHTNELSCSIPMLIISAPSYQQQPARTCLRLHRSEASSSPLKFVSNITRKTRNC